MSDQSIFLQKRNDLQLFIKEQIIGPGAFNKKFFFVDKWSNNEFVGKDLKNVSAFKNESEVLAEVPAYQYSSAILFPITKQLSSDSQTINSIDDIQAENEEEEQEEKSKPQDEETETSVDNSESISSKNQSYPNTCGIAFAVAEQTNFENDLIVKINFRTYFKVKQQQAINNKLGYWISENEDEIQKIIKQYFSKVFTTEMKDGNLFVILQDSVDINEYLYKIDYDYLNKLTKESFVPILKDSFKKDPIVELKKDEKKKIYGLKAKKEIAFYSISKEQTRGNEIFLDTITLFDEAIIDLLKQEIKENNHLFNDYKLLIQNLEIYNQVKVIVNDLKSIYKRPSRKNQSAPLWEAKTHIVKLQLPKFDKKKSGRLPLEGFDNLFLNYQYLDFFDKNNLEKKIYIKLILENKNVLNLDANEPSQLNKKDKANELALFGVSIEVQEKIENIIKQYNPPNLLDIDEEENLNKLIYRQYKDFAEGYNTSVSWGISNKLRYIITDFLPEQETPNVDHKPSKIVNDILVSRINMDVLSIKNLSTLSGKLDSEVISSLVEFINQYEVWIDDKQRELDNEIFKKDKGQLFKQLDKCRKDFLRLKRNISLLEVNKDAMVAFRIMNTAMFMQLHHSTEIKKKNKEKKSAYIPNSNSFDYYKNIESSYNWRAFQLAFILLNIDAFVRPNPNDTTVDDFFETGWPERNEIADLVWFPTGGGKTEAYLGIIAFTIAYRRFTKGAKGLGTVVLMRYTLRLLTLQQFQRATLLICALEAIRKDQYPIPHEFTLGEQRITIGLFVGGGSLPNTWYAGGYNENGMENELKKISEQIANNLPVETNLPHTECPWCGGDLFIDKRLKNTHPNVSIPDRYGINDCLKINCNSEGCSYHSRRVNENNCLPIVLFDEDIYKLPPTLLFGTMDKFAALANKVSDNTSERDKDSRRLFGNGYLLNNLPPELIIQDELHLLLGPLGSAVGLIEKAIDELCTYSNANGTLIKPKLVTSTATTRNTDKQIFALFNRRSEIFPKQGINCDDSFFAYYQRKLHGNKVISENTYTSNRLYVGLLPIGKTQVWMQLRIASICLTHHLKFIRASSSYEKIFLNEVGKEYNEVYNYYHTILSYFNSLKEVGKTQSQLSHYLPGDINLVTKNTLTWSFLDYFIRNIQQIDYSELTGRLTGEEVRTNLSNIERSWKITSKINPPEFVIATNMISVGIDVSRFNTMIINSMPRNTAEYIQATSRVARDKEGVVYTVHHPFRSRDISHYQKFKEFHEKFYGYVEPISVTPFANKALERYLAMYLAVIVRHDRSLGLSNNESAKKITQEKIEKIKSITLSGIRNLYENSKKLIQNNINVEGIIDDDEYEDILNKISELLNDRWLKRLQDSMDPPIDMKFRDDLSYNSLFIPKNGDSKNNNWNVKQSLREIAPCTVIKTVQQ